MPPAPKPFVVLLHTLPDGTFHWDLCLDEGQALATWQLLDDPAKLASGSATCLPARRIADHRRAYLEYEGPVSGNRGHVIRVDRGEWSVLALQTDRWRVRLRGSVLIGIYEIIAGADSPEWNLQRVEPR